MPAVFYILKIKTNQQPDIYDISKPRPNPELNLNLGMS